ncbi:MAG: hypothetical protein NC548_59050 [Lachnospiraceae bacterium]|nr:hypothetical protein [Lachnospiraceae bacterium]
MKKLMLIFALVAFLVGCSKKEEQLSVEMQTEQVEQTERNEQISLPSNEIFVDRVKILPNLHGNPQNSAHRIYLNDEVEFSSLPATPDFEKTLVVGSDLCVLYENVPKK